ncbi:MAG: hypothetical protein ABI591_04770 [Kofleriaceae bacterium]
MRVAAACALLAASAGELHADPRDVFGLAKGAEKALDCADGTDFGCARATDPLSDSVPYALASWLPAKYLLTLPVADSTHDAVAGYALGASRDEAGVNFAGANGLENRWTINGAPADNLRTGAADTKVPLTFLDGIMVTAGGFAARDRTSTGGMIDAQLRSATADHELEAHVWFGLSAAARHITAGPGVYQVRTGTLDAGPDVSASVVATGPLGAYLGGTTWYVLGIAPEVSRATFNFTAARLRDTDNNGFPDGGPGVLATDVIETNQIMPINYNVPVMARVGLDRGPHHLDLSIVGSIADATRYTINSTLPAGGVDATNVIGDAIATYKGEWKDTRAHLQLAWHHNSHTESARTDAAADLPQQLTAYVPTPLADDVTLGLQCADGGSNDPYPALTNCPVPVGWFYSGGAGLLQDLTADRLSITADVAHRFDHNVVRIGGTAENSLLKTDSRFTGGEQLRSLFIGEQSVRHFLAPDQPCSADVTVPCSYTDVSELLYRTLHAAAYVEDTWAAAPNLTVDGGLRWEMMWVGPVLHFSNQLAPRLGAAWDPLGNGRSRVWVSMGRSYAMLPAGLGSTILLHDRTVDELTFMGSTSRAVNTGEALLVAPRVEPIAQDELTAGAEVAALRQLRARVWGQGRWLRRGLESTPEGFDNPGRVDGMPALRDTELLAVELESNALAAFVLRVGYLWGHTTGSWTGAYDPRSGAALYNSSDFDVTSVNQNGLLPTDLGSRLYFEAQRRGRLGPVDMSVATRFTVAAGRPRDALGHGPDGLVYLIDRGEYGRGPLQTQANLRLAATYRRFEVTLDLFNLFDRRDATNLDTVYAGGAIHPIEGGTPEDLVFLRTDDGDSPGRPATRSQTYAQATAFQAPFSAVLGVHRSF